MEVNLPMMSLVTRSPYPMMERVSWLEHDPRMNKRVLFEYTNRRVVLGN